MTRTRIGAWLLHHPAAFFRLWILRAGELSQLLNRLDEAQAELRAIKGTLCSPRKGERRRESLVRRVRRLEKLLDSLAD